MPQETDYCSECTGDLSNTGVASMHMSGVMGGVVCGVTSRLGTVIHGVAPDPSRTDSERVAAARAAVVIAMMAVESHRRSEGVEPEVRTPQGWADMALMLGTIRDALQ